MLREFPSPPSLTGAATAFLTAVQESPEAVQSFLTPPPAPIGIDVSGLEPGTRYRVFPTGVVTDEDEIPAFDSLTPVYYVGQDDTHYIVKERDDDPDRIPKASFALSEYDSKDTIDAIQNAPKSPWGGRRRRRRTVRRRKTLRRKM